jgi:2-amino-4-hydroxy-6-hydroxymethyldihydropteridine diphosphokinase
MSNESQACSSTGALEDHLACLGLGSNVNPRRNLREAIGRLGRVLSVVAVSGAWESAAVGSDGPDYVNAAVLGRTPLAMERFTAELKAIEKAMGRTRGRRGQARLTIDIDVVVFDGAILEEDLWGQAYRAVPVGELLPDLCCLATGESLAQAAKRLADVVPIRPRPDILALPRQTEAPRNEPADFFRTRTQ